MESYDVIMLVFTGSRDTFSFSLDCVTLMLTLLQKERGSPSKMECFWLSVCSTTAEIELG